MVDLVTKEKIEAEAKRLKQKYKPKLVRDLEVIAKSEYGVKLVIEAPIDYGFVSGAVIRLGESIFIMYYASFKPYGTFALGHEIGHIALGHLDSDKIKQILFFN